MKTLGYVIIGFAVLQMFRQQQPSAATTMAPQDVIQSIRDQNAAFWASVGAPWETSNGQIVAPPDFSPGFSAAPFSDPGFNGT